MKLKIFKKKFKDFFDIFKRIFQEYSRNISPKTITKAIKKQVGVARVIPFAPYGELFFL
jgi:hypothetical protein